MWTVKIRDQTAHSVQSIRDQTAHSVQSDLDLQCPQQLLLLSSIWKELKAQYLPKKECRLF